jgi:hypothetical protein
MRWRFKWWYVGFALLLGLVALSFYRQAHRPIALGHTLADALRHDGFTAYLRPALPIVDHTTNADVRDKIADDQPTKDRLTTHPSTAGPSEVAKLLDQPTVAAAIVRALDRQGYYHDYTVNVVRDARDQLQKLPAEELLNRMITADVALLENDDDLSDSIQAALLLTAMQPTGAVGCAKSSTQTIYVLTLANDNSPDRATYLLTIFAFALDGHEAWTGTLEAPRNWSPEQIFAVLEYSR